MAAKVSWLIFVFITCFAIQSHAMGLYQVGDEIMGEAYNDVWKRWTKRTLTMWIGIDESGTAQLAFEADTGLGEAYVGVPYSAETVERLEQLLNTAIEWSAIAKKNHADTSQPLGCFPTFKHSICEKSGRPASTGQIGLLFSSTSEGQNTNLVIGLVDHNNQFKKADIYLDLPQMSVMLHNLTHLPAVLKKARTAVGKQDLFQGPGSSNSTKAREEKITESEEFVIEPLDKLLLALRSEPSPEVPSSSALERKLEIPALGPGPNTYLERVRQRISNFWSPQPSYTMGAYKAVVSFQLHQNGTVSNLEIKQSSGNEYYDLAARRAILNATPLPPFPPQISESHLDASFTFSGGSTSP